MKIPVIKIEQNGQIIYLTSLKYGDLCSKCSVDIWMESTNENGYQRSISESRAKKAKDFLITSNGTFPQSILINIRHDGKFIPSNLNTDIGGTYGILEIKGSEPWWIVDGQHRFKSLEYASAENPDFDQFDLPVSIITGYDQREEAEEFYIINTTHKGVSTDLAEQKYIHEADAVGWKKIELVKRGIRIIAESIKVLEVLDNDSSSPWFDKIQRPNEPRKPSHIVRQRSFTNSLKPVLDDPYLKSKKPEEMARLLILFWNAIRTIMPEAFDEPKNSVLLKTTGVYTMHRVFPSIYARCLIKQDFSEAHMEKILRKISYMDQEKWIKGGEIAARGTSGKTFNALAEEITIELDDKDPIS